MEVPPASQRTFVWPAPPALCKGATDRLRIAPSGAGAPIWSDPLPACRPGVHRLTIAWAASAAGELLTACVASTTAWDAVERQWRVTLRPGLLIENRTPSPIRLVYTGTLPSTASALATAVSASDAGAAAQLACSRQTGEMVVDLMPLLAPVGGVGSLELLCICGGQLRILLGGGDGWSLPITLSGGAEP